MTRPPMLVARDLRKDYPMNGEAVHALRGVSLAVRARGVRRHRGAVGQREVHPAAARGRHRHAERRQRRAAGHPARVPRRPRAHPAPAHPARLRLPALSPAAGAHRAGERRAARWRRPGSRGARAPGARPGAPGVRRARASRGPPGHPALGRRDAAGRHRPRARQPAGDPARRRADRRARRRDRPGDPRSLPPAQPRRHHPGRRHPRRAPRRRGGPGGSHARRTDRRRTTEPRHDRHPRLPPSAGAEAPLALPAARLRHRRRRDDRAALGGRGDAGPVARRLAGRRRRGDRAAAGHRCGGDADRRAGRNVLQHRAGAVPHPAGAGRRTAPRPWCAPSPRPSRASCSISVPPRGACRADRGPRRRRDPEPRRRARRRARRAGGALGRLARGLRLRRADSAAALRRARPLPSPAHARFDLGRVALLQPGDRPRRVVVPHLPARRRGESRIGGARWGGRMLVTHRRPDGRSRPLHRGGLRGRASSSIPRGRT